MLDDISQGHYERTMVSDQNGGQYRSLCRKLEVRTRLLKCVVLWLYVICFTGDVLLGKEKTSSNLKPGDGKIIIQDHIIRFVLQYQFDEMYSHRQLLSVLYWIYNLIFPDSIKCHWWPLMEMFYYKKWVLRLIIILYSLSIFFSVSFWHVFVRYQQKCLLFYLHLVFKIFAWYCFHRELYCIIKGIHFLS